jgi:hypothetical protein
MNALLAVCRQCDRYPRCPQSQQLADESAECPLAKWGNALPLGELVHRVAAPVARAIDFVAGTHLAGCVACEERRRALNEMGRALQSPERLPLE